MSGSPAIRLLRSRLRQTNTTLQSKSPYTKNLILKHYYLTLLTFVLSLVTSSKTAFNRGIPEAGISTYIGHNHINKFVSITIYVCCKELTVFLPPPFLSLILR